MLERIRHQKHLGTVVLMLFASLWLVALLAGVQVRVVLPQMQLPHDVCSTGTDAGWPETIAAGSLEDGPASGHGGHHDPDCLLCLALATPSAIGLSIYRPPAPDTHAPRMGPGQPLLAWQAQAPLPARGPPAIHG